MDCIGIKVRTVNVEKGKGLFAVNKYESGDIIFEESPLVCCQFAWNADYKYLACDYCLQPLESAEENARRLTGKQDLVLPFPECCETNKSSITECDNCDTMYCSIECKNNSWQRYHQSLCLQEWEGNNSHALFELKQVWKNMHYPPETTNIMLFARIIAMINQAMNKETIISTFTQFCHRTANITEEIAHNLLQEKFIGQIDNLRKLMGKALNTECVPEWFTPHGFQSLLALVGTNGQGIGTSPFSRWVKNVSTLNLSENERTEVDKLIDQIYDAMDEVVGMYLNNEGSGLYIIQSCINHSCIPNAVVEFPYSNSKLVVRAIRDIQPEEEICISYLDDCYLGGSRHTRQKVLNSLYLFTCTCEKCQQQIMDPDLTSSEEDSNTD